MTALSTTGVRHKKHKRINNLPADMHTHPKKHTLRGEGIPHEFGHVLFRLSTQLRRSYYTAEEALVLGGGIRNTRSFLLSLSRRNKDGITYYIFFPTT